MKAFTIRVEHTGPNSARLVPRNYREAIIAHCERFGFVEFFVRDAMLWTGRTYTPTYEACQQLAHPRCRTRDRRFTVDESTIPHRYTFTRGKAP
jgi:hypothetical protein